MKRFIVALSFAAISSTAVAGMDEKIAQKTASSMLDEAKQTVVTSCGNPKLDISIDWSAYDKYDYTSLRREPKQIMTWAGALGKQILEDLAEMCSKGPHADLFKEEITKLTSVKFYGQKAQDTNNAEFALEGNTLSVALNASSAYNSKNKELIKKVW